MSDRYQPGASVLSFLNPWNRYYVDRDIKSIVNEIKAVTETKKEIADSLTVINTPTDMLTATPKPVVASETAKEEGIVPVTAPKEEIPVAATLNDTLANAEAPKFNAPPQTPAAENAVAADIAEKALETAEEAGITTDPKVAAEEQAAAAEEAAPAKVIAETAADNDVVAEAVAEAAEEVAENVEKESVLPGVEADGEAVAEAAEVAESFDPGCKCLKGLKAKCRCVDNVPEQLKQTTESFIFKDINTITAGPSGVIEGMQKAAIAFKQHMTGAGNPQKTTVEKFCDEHWHKIATTVIAVIMITLIVIAGMSALGLITVIFDIKRNDKPQVSMSQYQPVTNQYQQPVYQPLENQYQQPVYQ